MSLHSEIMRLQIGMIREGLDTLPYRLGHRDARHAAAELALKADKRIEELESALKEIKFCCAVPARQTMRKIATDALGDTP